MRILLMDNEGDVIDQILNDITQSYVVDVAYNSDDGSCLTQVNDYDALVVGPTFVDDEKAMLYSSLNESNKSIPIAVIFQEDSPERRIKELDSGADICMKYPICVSELNAQLRALIRRNSPCPKPIIKVGNICLNTSKKQILFKDRVIPFRKKEYEVLEFLLMHKGKIISKEQLLEHVWEKGIYVFSNIVEVQIRYIRLKFKKYRMPNIIKNIRELGYIIEG